MPTVRTTSERPVPAAADLRSILIIDDSDGDALLAELVLGELAPQASIRHIDTGSRALDALQLETFDLILLDLAMPGLTGFDVLTALGDRPGFDTDILVLTSSSRPEDREAVIERGAGFVVKDSDFGSFRRHLAAALNVAS